MKHQFNNDNDILIALHSGVSQNISAALRHLLGDRIRAFVRKQVLALGGQEDDAREMLTAAVLEFYNKVSDNEYDPALSSISTYIVKIATQKYYTKHRSEMRRLDAHNRASEVNPQEYTSNPEIEMDFQHRKEWLKKILPMTGEKCHEALSMYSYSFSMAEIAEKVNYKNADAAKVAVMACRKKLNKILSERTDLLNELHEL